MHDFTAQFERENHSRKHRGLEPHADITAYLVAQGFSEAEARKRARDSRSVEVTSDDLNAAAVYAKANQGHEATVYGAVESEAFADDKHESDVAHGGRVPGVSSPADYLEHANRRGRRAGSTPETRDWDGIREDAYRLANAGYAAATGDRAAVR